MFDLDYDKMEEFDLSMKFYTDLFFAPCLCLLSGNPFYLCFSCPMYYLCGKQNVSDDVRSRHLAITHDGIKYVHDKHKKDCRWDCQDQGEWSGVHRGKGRGRTSMVELDRLE